MKWTVFFLAILVSSTVYAEIVTTTDGRQIELKDDGTFQMLALVDVHKTTAKVSYLEPFFQHFAGEYGQNQMRFMPKITNETDRTIVGFKFTTSFISAFGDEVFKFSGESAEKVEPSKSSTADTFYFFEDNQFIAGQPYDKLQIFETSGTGKIETKIDAIVYSDGVVEKY
ncbi:hypothetical protein ACEN2J_04415 [Pseudorhodobacter sp. W20_MBD10_FR17]|uniref:hypothetical protein n=1 Tax=Pseudorhodobacter sp. W20_MBD10_FR17 TaxID=3240266 RepID=UPI003F9CAF34